MKSWAIHYLNADGSEGVVNKLAHDKASARVMVNLPDDRIVKISLRRIASLLLSSPPPRVQILVLTQLAAFSASGRDPGELLPNLKAHTSLAPLIEQSDWTPNQKISLLLEILRFNPAVPALVSAGEKSGKLPHMLAESADYLLHAEEIKEGVSGKVYMGLALVLLTLFALFTLPGALGNLLDTIKEPGVATSILIALRDLVAGYGFLLLLGLGVFAIAGWRYNALLTRLPVINLYHAMRRARRSAVLLSVLRPLFRAGIEQDAMLHIATGAVGPAVEDLSDEMLGGSPFSKALATTSRWWSPTLISALTDFELIHEQGREQMLSMLLKALNAEQRDYSLQTAWSVNIIGSVMAVFQLYLLAAGFYIPISSAQ